MSQYEGNQDASHEHSHHSGSQQAVESGVVALSSNDFAALEDRILRAVEVVRRERQSRAAAEQRAAQAEARLAEQAPMFAQLEQELHALRLERDQVRVRVERLLGQLDAIEL